MVSIENEWKLKPTCKAEIFSFCGKNSFHKLKKIVENESTKFTDENLQWVEDGILAEEEFLAEKKARKALLNAICLYARVSQRFTKGFNENYFLLLDESWRRIRNELNVAINRVFSLELNGSVLKKRMGESIEHYLMRYIILKHLDERYGVREFQEEYSKLKEVLRSFVEGKADEKEWEKVAKRADLYVVLNDNTKLWIEVERTTSSSDINKKLKRIKKIFSYFPKLIDKVVFVFSSLITAMTEATFVEARKIGFPEQKFEFYEVNLREARIAHLIDPKLVGVEFGDRIFDMIVDKTAKPTKKTAGMVRDRIREKIIFPLVNNKFEQRWVKEKKEKIRRLIRFWRMYTTKFSVSDKELEFKVEALKRIKQNYPFLLK